MIRIAEYDEVDPLQVLHLNLLSLGFALTPELVALIRRMDPRPFPCFAIYALEGEIVLGQVGIFRLPVVSGNGAEEVGGVWAVSTHPAYRGRGIATLLLDEAHTRMAAARLRYATLGTDSYRVAHRLYQEHGYTELFAPVRALARCDNLPARHGLRVEPAGANRLDEADQLFERIARGHHGFARRHTPFFAFLRQRDYLDAEALWLVWHGDDAVGYALISIGRHLLSVENLLLADEIDPVAAVVALVQATSAPYVQVRLDRPAYALLFTQAGFDVAPQGWETFMVKPLARDATAEQFRHSFGVNNGRFLISSMDVT